MSDIDLINYSLEEMANDFYNPSQEQESHQASQEPVVEEVQVEEGDSSFVDGFDPLQEEETGSAGNEDPTNALENTSENTPTNVVDDDGSKFSPLTFKANGTEVTLENREEVIRLLQQGMGARKLVADYKETRPIVKALRDNGLFDEGLVNTLIAARQGDAKAYKALQGMFGINHEALEELNYADEDGKDYVAQNKIEDSNLFNLRDTVTELDTDYPSETTAVKELFSTLDTDSVLAVRNDPSILLDLAHLKQTGMLDTILADTEKAYMLGKVGREIPKIQVISAISNALSQQVGYNILDRNIRPPAKQQNHLKQQAPQPITPPQEDAKVQRRMAGGTPERYAGGSRQNSNDTNTANSALEKLRKGATADDGGAANRKLLSDIYGINFDE